METGYMIYYMVNKLIYSKTKCIVLICFCLIITGCSNQKPNFYKHNFHILASQGTLVNGRVLTVQYVHNAPMGWRIYYSFTAKNGRVYEGESMGPKEIISRYKSNNNISIAYLPQDPRINLAFFYLLNCPSYKKVKNQVLKNPGFKGEIGKEGIYDYSLKEWWHETRLE